MTLKELAIWLPCVAFVAGIGGFLDKYYNQSWPQFIGAIRYALIAVFVFIDDFHKRQSIQALAGLLSSSGNNFNKLVTSKYWGWLEKAITISAIVWIPISFVLNLLALMNFERDPLLRSS